MMVARRIRCDGQSFLATAKDEEVDVRYYDWFMIAADFSAPVGRVRRVLPSDKLKPVEIAPGMAQVSLMAMAYRRLERLAPYNEFGVLIPVQYSEPSTDIDLPGYYVLQLPVTSQEACDGGVVYYGYPKFVAQIDFNHSSELHSCYVRADGRTIVTLEASPLATSTQAWDLYTFTVKDDQLLRTLIQIQGQSGSTSAQGGARYTLGDHPVARQIQALEMREPSIGHQYAPQLQSILNPPGERLSL
jgi:hypothetical protein